MSSVAQTRALLPTWVVPVVPENEVLTQTAVVIEDDCIAAIIPAESLKDAYPNATVERLDGHVLIPGLVNAHGHSPMVLMRGLADDLPLMEWLSEHIWPAEQAFASEDFVRAGSELAVVEMLLGGTTCFNDNYFFPNITAEVVDAAGIRAVLGLPVMNVPTIWAEDEAGYIEKGLWVIDAVGPHERIGFAWAPHAPYTVSDASFERLGELTVAMNLKLHLHLLETSGEIAQSQADFGCHPIDRLVQLGLYNERLIAAHMTQLTDAQIEQTAEAGVHVLHCPAANMKLASGFCRIADLDRAGVNIAIGTDGAASNNRLDMFAEMRLASLIAKGFSLDPVAASAPRTLTMATMGGARALGLEASIGSIEVGKKADLVAVDLADVGTSPVHHVISHLVYAAGRHQVSHVWVNGQPVVKSRHVTTLEAGAIRETSQIWANKMINIK